ncbi:hypothetical protein [Nocardia cyriacigeorgica]|uniref:hypothetical protein n=1 Tax=Nocardia cyriacigeorgica TaxID=135487 RepID=UPI0018960CC2|nr:hypothetical protein [Nocardia cyriacigeorgica]MBF6286402.1 hypothetical protein [Nocardia cyriacigeorgica]
MRSTVRSGLAAAAIIAAGLTALAPSAAAQPSMYNPVIRPCSHLFRTPLELPRPGTDVYWSPFGTGGIVCFDDGTGMENYYQRDPWGAWHDMNELRFSHQAGACR